MVLPNFLGKTTLQEANKVDPSSYSFIRYSETQGQYLFKKRRNDKDMPNSNIPNFVEAKTVDEANKVNPDLYRFDCYVDSTCTWVFTKRMRSANKQ